MLRELVETKEYDNVKFDYLERWCIEIERCLANGMKTKIEKTDTKKSNKQMRPSTSKAIEYEGNSKRGRFVITSDSESEISTPEKVQPTLKATNQKAMNHEKVTIIISSETDSEKTNEEEEYEYIEFSSSDEESD